ncbi:hypothetical protein [Hyphomonas sp.]|uniref:hypothetical protein n=1 Tax=Hyphomonas sp. TaxID=87 RepID=UPI0025C5D14F|nr:hypothetical protein [Hyphomonas sp.]
MRFFGTLSLAMLCLLLAACGQGASQEEAFFDEDAATEDAIAEYTYSTYEDIFGSYQCTYDCSGHDAGFEWAKENMILDGYGCSGDSNSFVEGCEAYGEAIADYVATAHEDHP